MSARRDAGLSAPHHAADGPCRARAWQRARSSPRAPTARSSAPTGSSWRDDRAADGAGAGAARGSARATASATLAMNHDRHLAAWFGVVGMGGVLHTLNPRLFDDQLDYIINHAEDRVLLYDARLRAAGRAAEAAAGRRSSITSASTDEFDDLARRRGRRLSLARRRRARALRPVLHQRHDRAIPRACSTSIARPCFTRCRSSRPTFSTCRRAR